jgi:hypothetical protein
MGQFNEKVEQNKSIVQLTLELIATVWYYGVLVYIVRNLAERIPFPLDGYQGFDHKKVKELSSATVFTFMFILFSDYIKSKLIFYYNVVLHKKILTTEPVL